MAISPDAIARGILFALEQPPEVDVGSIVIRPTAREWAVIWLADFSRAPRSADARSRFSITRAFHCEKRKNG
jgi:hypothetical protein